MIHGYMSFIKAMHPLDLDENLQQMLDITHNFEQRQMQICNELAKMEEEFFSPLSEYAFSLNLKLPNCKAKNSQVVPFLTKLGGICFDTGMVFNGNTAPNGGVNNAIIVSGMVRKLEVINIIICINYIARDGEVFISYGNPDLSPDTYISKVCAQAAVAGSFSRSFKS